jgi:hypothetical protein
MRFVHFTVIEQLGTVAYSTHMVLLWATLHYRIISWHFSGFHEALFFAFKQVIDSLYLYVHTSIHNPDYFPCAHYSIRCSPS